ncbi:Chromosome partition protein Smc [uncultured archaeon]|nr:Chromosome partition protein Smc [uncultured archaeon]
MDAEIFSLADKVIDNLKMRKIVELQMLIKETGGDEKDIRKIINLLEQQGMADVEYKLTKVVISWNDEPDRVRAPKPHMRHDRISFDSSGKGIKEYSKPAAAASSPLASSKYSVKLQSDLPDASVFEQRFEEKRSKGLGTVDTDMEELPEQGDERKSLLDLGFGREDSFVFNEEQKPKDHTVQKGPVAQRIREETPERKERKQAQQGKAPLASDRLMPKTDRIGKQPHLTRREERIRKEVDGEVKAIERSIRSKLRGRAPEPDLAETDIVTSVRKEHSARKAKGRSAVLKKYSSTPGMASAAARITPRDSMQESVQSFSIDVADNLDDEVRLPEMERREERARALSADLGAKMDMIRERKSEIALLTRQKAGMLDESYAPMESRLDAELTVISDIVSEREKRLKGLRDRLKALPENLGSLEVESIELKNAETEAKARFDGVLADLQTLASEIKTIKSSANTELVDVKRSLRQQETDLHDLRELHAKYKEKESLVQGAIDNVKGRIDREQAQLGELENRFMELQTSSSDIEMRLNEVDARLGESATYGRSASDMINRLRELEGGISTVHTAYSDAKSRLLDDIDRYERELSTMRESIEAGFARKYLAEIERLTERHDQELVAVADREREIDDRLAEKRAELRGLIGEARDLQDRVSASLPRRQTRPIEEIKRDLEIGPVQPELQEKPDSGSFERRGMVDSLGDILSRFRKGQD